MNRTRLGQAALAGITVAAAVALCPGAASAIPGRTMVSNTSVSDSATFKGADAQCPAGTVILGGGARITGGDNHVRLNQMGPQKNMWVVAASEDAYGYAGDWSVTTWAICAPAPAGYAIVNQDLYVNTWGTVSVPCPAGRVVLGMGGLVWATNIPNGVLDTVRTDNGMTNVLVTAYHDETMPAPGTSMKIAAIAICAFPPPDHTLVTGGTVPSSSDKTRDVICPLGTLPSGLGGHLDGGSGEVGFTEIAPLRTGMRVTAREDSTGFPGTWYVEPYMICAG